MNKIILYKVILTIIALLILAVSAIGTHGQFVYTDPYVLIGVSIFLILIMTVILQPNDISGNFLSISKILGPLVSISLLAVQYTLFPVRFTTTSTVLFVGLTATVLFSLYLNLLMFKKK